jgi:hypothetical protein
MAKGDVVKIHQNEKGNNVAVFEPLLDPGRPGYYLTDAKNNVLVRAIGGVKPGSFGKIDGDGVKVAVASVGVRSAIGLGDDSTMLYPVLFEEYQKVGWITSDSFRIIEGGTL